MYGCQKGSCCGCMVAWGLLLWQAVASNSFQMTNATTFAIPTHVQPHRELSTTSKITVAQHSISANVRRCALLTEKGGCVACGDKEQHPSLPTTGLHRMAVVGLSTALLFTAAAPRDASRQEESSSTADLHQQASTRGHWFLWLSACANNSQIRFLHQKTVLEGLRWCLSHAVWGLLAGLPVSCSGHVSPVVMVSGHSLFSS
jgi:hypothetical protein